MQHKDQTRTTSVLQNTVREALEGLYLERENGGVGAMQNSGFKNSLLKSLAPEIVDRLRLRRVAFKVGQDIEFPGNPSSICFSSRKGWPRRL
jgi:hypothetical protein